MRLMGLIFFLLLGFLSQAQNEKGKLEGVVSLSESGDEAIGAIVYISDKSEGAVVDINGKYLLELYPGSYTIICSYIGCATITTENVEIKQGQTKRLDFNLLNHNESLFDKITGGFNKEELWGLWRLKKWKTPEKKYCFNKKSRLAWYFGQKQLGNVLIDKAEGKGSFSYRDMCNNGCGSLNFKMTKTNLFFYYAGPIQCTLIGCRYPEKYREKAQRFTQFTATLNGVARYEMSPNKKNLTVFYKDQILIFERKRK